MSQHIKHVSAALVAVICLAGAATISAAEPADNPQTVAVYSAGVCHPAYVPCSKKATKAASTSIATEEKTRLLRGEFEFMPVGSTCHPAYRPCPGWSYWERNYPVVLATR